MKKKIVKTVLCLALAGTLAFSGAGTAWTGLNTVEAAKVVSPTTLGQVTGIKYDVNKQKLSWNKVSNATQYQISIKDSEGSTSKYTTLYTYKNLELAEGTYTVSIVARDTDNFYVVPQGSEYDTGDYDKVTKKTTYYKYPAGPAGTATIQVSNQAVTDRISSIPGVEIQEVLETGVTFKVSGNYKLNEGERVQWQYSNNASFSNSGKNNFTVSTSGISSGDVTVRSYHSMTVSFVAFNPGDTIYVRAQVYNANYKKPNATYTYISDKYGPYTAAASYKVPKSKISGVNTYVDATSITLSATLKGASATGYQFAKKVNSKWVTLGTQTSATYVDKNLAKNTRYQYRVRAYHYNQLTKKTTWTDWYTAEATTWGATLNLKAAAASSTSVKLSWTPVSGAEGYEIYRCDTDSAFGNTEKGMYTTAFEANSLIKTIKGSKTKTYTDKKLSKGRSYIYIVRAYKTINKKKCYIEDSASATLKAGTLNITSYYYTAAGKLTATWQKMTGISGYYVEKYDEATGQYVQVKKLSAKATSYTFAKVNIGSDPVKYRIRPYDKTNVYSGRTLTVEPTLAAVQKVKAVKTANGIKVSWNPVAGADYYKVYRTTNSNLIYDKTTKTYSFRGNMVYDAAVNTDNCRPELGSGYSSYNSAGTYRSSEIRGTSVVDATVTYRSLAYDENGRPIKIGTSAGADIYQTVEEVYYQGPEPGVTYYYYVVACVEAPNGSLNYTSISSIGCTKPASATYTNTIAKKVSKITSASSQKKGQVTIKYKKVSGVDGYAIYRSTKKNGTYTMVGTSTKTSFTDASAQSGKTYYYKVASYKKSEAKANVYSAKTAAKKVKVK